jgi:hypothetical protein
MSYIRAGIRAGCWLVLILITLAGLLGCALEAYMTAILGDYDIGGVHTETGGGLMGRLILAAFYLLFVGVNLYILKITSGWRRWANLPLYKKAITVIPIVTGLLVIVFWCFALTLGALCSADPDCY